MDLPQKNPAQQTAKERRTGLHPNSAPLGLVAGCPCAWCLWLLVEGLKVRISSWDLMALMNCSRFLPSKLTASGVSPERSQLVVCLHHEAVTPCVLFWRVVGRVLWDVYTASRGSFLTEEPSSEEIIRTRTTTEDPKVNEVWDRRHQDTKQSHNLCSETVSRGDIFNPVAKKTSNNVLHGCHSYFAHSLSPNDHKIVVLHSLQQHNIKLSEVLWIPMKTGPCVELSPHPVNLKHKRFK